MFNECFFVIQVIVWVTAVSERSPWGVDLQYGHDAYHLTRYKYVILNLSLIIYN